MTYVQPLLLAFLIVGFVGWWRLRKTRGAGLVAIGLGGLFLISWPPVDWLLSRPLAARSGRDSAPMESAQAIVVLSSSVSPPPASQPDKDTYERCARAAWLYAHGHRLPILACGGGGMRTPYSETMRQLLESWGIPPAMIWTERESHSTHENAEFGAAILKEHGIGTVILSTEEQDMLRAELCFRKAGLTVIPDTISIRDVGPLRDELLPTWKAIARNERTLHESLGLAWYWVRGWI